MLAIKLENGSWRNWWLGYSIPEVGRVVTFQADGDELNLFLDAMAASAGELPKIAYYKRQGFESKE